MRILVTNDDGVESAGIIALAEALRALGEVTVVAPDSDRSGVSHGITVQHAVRVERVEGRAVPTYACSGLPADCVVVGAFDLCGGTPDVVVSGINRGANLGDDVAYSGTVAAAVEAALLGMRAIAVSLASSWPKIDDVHHWETAAGVVLDLLADPTVVGLPSATLLNVNVPNRARGDLAGVLFTRLGRKIYHERIESRTESEDGAAYYRIWGRFDRSQIGAGTDLEAVLDGYASVAPLGIDRTDHQVLERLQGIAAGHG